MLLPRANFNFLSCFRFYLQYADIIICCSGGSCTCALHISYKKMEAKREVCQMGVSFQAEKN